MEYKDPVTFTVDGTMYEWEPEGGLLADKDDFEANATEQAIRLFLEDLASEYGEKFPAAPEGPYLPTTTKSLSTTVYMLNVIFPKAKIKVDGEAPTMFSMGLGGAPRLLEDGSEVVD